MDRCEGCACTDSGGGCSRYCPMAHLDRLGVPVIEVDLRGRRAQYDFRSRRVEVVPGLTPAERRSALAHEVIHVLADDALPATWWGELATVEVEDDADELAARALIPDLHALIDTLRIARDVEQAASMLHVDVRMVQVRVRTLTPPEARHLRLRTMHRHREAG